MLQELIRFPTYAGNGEAHAAQKAWLFAMARELGFEARDAGKITEIELPGPQGAPVLGLVIHGDVQPVDAEAWTFPPFAGEVRDGYVLGRGAADDKGRWCRRCWR
jgi:acetylornithine deacetylase/succinyl-diaminopimelate desuccinylase-like protein